MDAAIQIPASLADGLGEAPRGELRVMGSRHSCGVLAREIGFRFGSTKTENARVALARISRPVKATATRSSIGNSSFGV